MGHRTNQQLKTAVKLHIDQMMRNRNSKARNDAVERGSVTKSQKGNKGYVETGKWESVFSGKHTDNVSKETLRLTEKKSDKEENSYKRSQILCR